MRRAVVDMTGLLDDVLQLPAIAHADRGSAHVEVFEAAIGCELVTEVAPGADHLELLEAVADAGGRLPGQVGVARAHVGIERHEPAALVAEGELPFRARDAIPSVAAHARLAGLGRTDERAERRAELPMERRLRVELARAREDVERRSFGSDRAVTRADGESSEERRVGEECR